MISVAASRARAYLAQKINVALARGRARTWWHKSNQVPQAIENRPQQWRARLWGVLQPSAHARAREGGLEIGLAAQAASEQPPPVSGEVVMIMKRTIGSSAALDSAMKAAFSSWFGLERTSTVVLVQLYRLGGEPVTAEQLAVLSASTRSGVQNHHVSKLRQALNTEGLDFEPGRGYRLTDEGMAECLAVLRSMSAELLAA